MRVVGSRARGEVGTVYNLTIADFHTYFVGKAGVLVHNVSGCDAIAGKVLGQGKRIQAFYDRLQLAKPARSADEAFELLSKTMNRVEDLYSGIAAVADPGLKYTGRMYPPRADYMTRLASGGLEAITKGQRILFAPDGGIQIFRKGTGELLFSKPGL